MAAKAKSKRSRWQAGAFEAGDLDREAWVVGFLAQAFGEARVGLDGEEIADGRFEDGQGGVAGAGADFEAVAFRVEIAALAQPVEQRRGIGRTRKVVEVGIFAELRTAGGVVDRGHLVLARDRPDQVTGRPESGRLASANISYGDKNRAFSLRPIGRCGGLIQKTKVLAKSTEQRVGAV